MASGDAVVQVMSAMPPATLAATIGQVTGASTPAEFIDVFIFDPSTIWYMDFKCRLVKYAGGGLTFQITWASGATTGDVIWGIAIRRIADDAEDLDTTAHTYDYNEATSTTASAAGELDYVTITFTDGADMDSWATGEMAFIRVRRNATAGGDTMNANNAWLVSISGTET